MPAEETSAPSAQDAEQGETDPPSKLDNASRLSGEQPGPSRAAPRQGYCSCCQIVYNSVEQHILSPRHREVVRGSRTQVISGSLMERFLLDVIQHHPHRYNDPRPTHADLPSLNSPLVPREELSDVCLSDDDGFSLATREDMPGSDDSSCQLVDVRDERAAPATTASQPEESRGEGEAGPERLTPPRPDQSTTRRSPVAKTRTPSPDRLHTRSPRPQTPPLVHRKAHRKTNRRRERGSSSSSVTPPAAPITSRQEHQPTSKPREQSPDPKPRAETSGWGAWAGTPPWRRDARRDEAFSSDRSDPVGEVIEEVIQRHCYGRSPTRRHRGDADSFRLSLPGSLGGGGSGDSSEDWDGPVQAALGRGGTDARREASGEAAAAGWGGEQGTGRDVACLMDVRVNLDDQGYAGQLDSALNPDAGAGAGAAGGGASREPTVEEILPALPHIPASFLGKTWTQVLLEDDRKVEAMVREFRQGCSLSYFDSESLARYGRRSREQKGRGQKEGQSWEANVLPLAEHDDDEDPECTWRRKGRRRGRRRSFRMASRCQVVKVSHGTQTAPLVAPMVRQHALDQTGTAPDGHALCQDPSAANVESEKTPEMKTRQGSLRLPPSYTRIMTPLQPKTALVYVLSSPESPPTDPKPRLRPVARGKRKKSCDADDVAVKVKYKRVPLRYYDPATHRILKTPPKGLVAGLSPGLPRPAQPHVVRQLFRSLSPDINSERQGGEGRPGGDVPGGGGGRRRGRSAGSAASGPPPLEPGGSTGVKGQGSSEAGSSVTSPFSRSSLSNSSRFLLGAPAPEPRATRRQSSRGAGRGQQRGRRTSRSEPPSPGEDPSSPPRRPQRPGMGRGGAGGEGRREKPASRSSKRGRPASLSPSPPPRRGPPRRAVESRKLPGPKGPAGAPPRGTPPAALKPPRAVGLRTSPRLAPAPRPALRSSVRR